MFRVLTSLIRSGNNLLGGISFVIIAKLFGVQKSAEPEPAAPAAAAPAGAKGGKKKSK